MFLANMFGGLKRSLFSDGAHSKSVAKSRLQFVLVQDRAGMSSEEMTKFRKELIGVIEKYFKVEKNRFDITYKREGELTTLLINSPVIVKREGGAPTSPGSGKDKGKADTAAIPAVANESA